MTPALSPSLSLIVSLSPSIPPSVPLPLPLSMTRVSDEQCVMIMSVRKGKRLIARLLPLLPSPQATAVVMAIARNLPALAKKDKQDQVTNQQRVAGSNEGLPPAGGAAAGWRASTEELEEVLPKLVAYWWLNIILTLCTAVKVWILV